MTSNKPELLSPAGNFECVKAAVQSGCNAVYLGGKQFNARAYAGNFDNAQLEETIDYCHLHDVKVYITVNTLYKNDELPELLSFISELNKMGADGLIMQDIGAINLVKKNFPGLPVHASTQLTATNVLDAKYYEETGLTTMVCSRELSLKEIKEICSNSNIRVEVFIHGALCVCYSGQCLMSAFKGGRSGNRGKCAQPCRQLYTLVRNGKKVISGYLLSTKDICTLDNIPSLIEAGVASFKIEGRMKSKEYVAGVTAIYRKYIDMYFDNPKKYHVDEKDREILLQLFNRGGFSNGYLNTHSGSEMMSINRQKNAGIMIGTVREYNPRNELCQIKVNKDMIAGDGIEIYSKNNDHPGCFINKNVNEGEILSLKIKGNIHKGDLVYRTFDKKLTDFLDRTIEKNDKKLLIEGKIKLLKNQTAKLKFIYKGISAETEGDVVEQAVKLPLDDKNIYKQIAKLGATDFKLDNLEIEKDSDIYLNVSSLNSLRSACAEELKKSIIELSKQQEENYELPVKNKTTRNSKKVSVLVNSFEQLKAAKKYDVDRFYINYSEEVISNIKEYKEVLSGKDLLIALPRIVREDYELNEYADGYLIRTINQYQKLKNSGKKLYLDYSFNIFNYTTASYWNNKCDAMALSLECSLDEVNSIASDKSEILGYGKVAVMTTHQCPIGNFVGEKKNSKYCKQMNHKDKYMLVDYKNEKYELICDCKRCVCSILIEEPINIINRLEEFDEGNFGGYRLDFTNESPIEVENLINKFLSKEKSNTENYGMYYGHVD